jgi:phospholipase/carboxylesterase
MIPSTELENVMVLLPAIENETRPNPDASVIWLHGLGADGSDFAPIVPELNLPEELGIRFIFPHAPSISVTVNNGYVMPAWFDILEMDIDRKVDADQLLVSADAINRLIDRELERGIASRRIILAGFSQGGAVAYQVCLSHPQPLGGLIAMSTYFATSDSVQLSQANQKLSIEIQHGLYDPVVPPALGIRAAEFLKDRGYTVAFRTYPMDHSVCPQQIGDISSALQRFLVR